MTPISAKTRNNFIRPPKAERALKYQTNDSESEAFFMRENMWNAVPKNGTFCLYHASNQRPPPSVDFIDSIVHIIANFADLPDK